MWTSFFAHCKFWGVKLQHSSEWFLPLHTWFSSRRSLWCRLCNETNPIFKLPSFFWSFCLPYCLPFVVTWLSGSCQAPWTATMLLCTWPRGHSHDCQSHHVTVSLIFYLPFTLLTTYSQLLLCYSALPLTSILTPQCSLHFSLVCHLYLLLHSLYYDSLPYQSFSPHDLLSYQTTLATNLTTLAILFSPYTLITFTSCITHLYD